VRLVVADAGPLHYLVLIGHIDILPRLFERIYLPSVVRSELSHAETPQPVREWIMDPPPWLEVRETPLTDSNDPLLQKLDDGERAAISLALSMAADILLMDDRKGVSAARKKGFTVAGTLGVLDLAARRGLLNLARALDDLKSTNFRYRQQLLDDLLAQHNEERNT